MKKKGNEISHVPKAILVRNKILHAPKALFAKKKTSKQALILFTRLPVAGKTKTRLIPYLGKKGARDIHLALLQDFAKLYRNFHRKEKEVKLFLFFSPANLDKVDNDIIDEVYKSVLEKEKKESDKEKGGIKEEITEEEKDGIKEGEKKDIKEGRNEGIAEMKILRKLFPDAEFVPQEGEDIFRKMENAFLYTFQEGYSFSYLVGADIPFLSEDSFCKVFSAGRSGKNVLGESLDGGYYGIGLQSRVKSSELDKIFSLGKKREDFKVNPEQNRLMKPECAEREKQEQEAGIFEYTKTALYSTGLPLLLLKKRRDIDDKEDITAYRELIPYNKALQNSFIGKEILRQAKISIIIPCYKEGDTLRKMEEQLRPYKKEAEILFADGGENHFSGEYKVVSCPKGRAKQMNTAAKVASGDILFFLHCDSILPKGFLEEIREALRKTPVACFGIRFSPSTPLMMICSFISNHRVYDRKVMFGDQGIFLGRELFFQMGGFPDLPLMEDYQFSLNLKKCGIPMGLCKKRLITSERRFSGSFFHKLSIMWKMNRLRARYRKGEDINALAKEYRDIR